MRNLRLVPLLPVAGAVILLDQFTKQLIVGNMPLHTGRVLIPGFFNLVHVRNTGAAFSMFAGENSALRLGFFIGMAVLILGVLLYTYARTSPDERWIPTAYSFVVGGALGNLIDRLRLGEVVDFLDFYIKGYHWPAFNVADIAISTGAVMLAIALFRTGKI